MFRGPNSKEQSVRLMVITTIDATLDTFFHRQLTDMAKDGLAEQRFIIHAVSSPGRRLENLAYPGDGISGSITPHAIPMERQPHPMRDLVSLWRLYRLMRRIRPHIVHVHTPKAGLLGMLAAKAAGVKVRIYTIHGLPLETRQGRLRQILELAERATCLLATQVYSVSKSLEQVIRGLHLCADGKITTLGDGSCSGIDVKRFDPESIDQDARAKVRAEFGIPPHAQVLCFVGRVARDKGIEFLAAAWQPLSLRFPDAHLLLCGSDDLSDPVSPATLEALRTHPRVHLMGPRYLDVPAIYAVSDVCVLPTFREGLPQVALEAGAMGLPLVSTRVTGVVDAVQDGVTGLLVPARDAAQLADALERLLRDATLRQTLGTAARRYVHSRFSSDRVHQMWMNEYSNCVRENFSRLEKAIPQAETGRL
ncbi:MAG: glycosyltransferase family 4 protein [Acidobacteriota bacterium]